MENETYGKTKNSNTIPKKEKLAFIERFKKACKERGYTLQQLQTMLGMSNGYFRNMGYIKSDLAPEIKKLIPDLNVEFINAGTGQMFLTEEQVKKDEKAQKGIVVPLLPINARGGTLTGFSEGVNTSECEMITTPIDGAELAITVTGDSMEPEYPSGCVVLIKKINEKAFIEWGKTYILDTCNGVVIKKLFPKSDDATKFICRSNNAAYPDFDVRYTDVYGIYKVLLQMSLK